MPTRVTRLGDVQLSALEIYIFDPAHDETPFPGHMEGSTLVVDDVDAAAALLTEASNCADGEPEGTRHQATVDALDTIAARLRRAHAKEQAT